MPRTHRVTRRDALKLAAVAAAPIVLPGRLFGADAPSKQVTLAAIGIGWQGGGNLGQFLGNTDCRVLACCDVDETHLKSAVDKVNQTLRQPGLQGLQGLPRADRPQRTSTPWPSPRPTTGIRSRPSRRPTPRRTSSARSRCRTRLPKASPWSRPSQQNRRIWQTGSWQRSVLNFRWARRTGRQRLHRQGQAAGGRPARRATPTSAGTGDKQPNCDPPKEVDYDFWIGPAKMMPFNPCRFHKNWRWCYNTGGGQLMDWIGHHCDIGHWGLSNREVRLRPGRPDRPAGGLRHGRVPAEGRRLEHGRQIPHRVQVSQRRRGGDRRRPRATSSSGTKWIGENGWICGRPRPFRRLEQGMGRDATDAGKKQVEAAEAKMDFKLMVSNNHNGPVHRLRQVADRRRSRRSKWPIARRRPGHLGYIASVVGRKLKWDAAKQEIVGDPEAAKLMSKQFRPPWHA